MALSDQGFKRETYNEILDRTIAEAKNKFGENTNTSERSVLGMLLRVWAFLLSNIWQVVEQVYYSAFLRTAEGIQLDNVAIYSGITRNPATLASGDVVFTGTTGTVIPSGFYITKSDGTLYFTVDNAVIAAGGTVLVSVVAEEPGVSGNAEIGEINGILNPAQGIISVNNPQIFSNGNDIETDAALRLRAETAGEGQGSGTAASIRAELLKNPEIRSAFVDENYGTATNSYNTPPKSIQAFVLGGTDKDVAEAIHAKRAAGIQPYGTSSYPVEDMSGVVRITGFTRTTTKRIYAKTSVVTNLAFPADGEDLVKDAMTSYVGGLGTDSNYYNGTNAGESVLISKLIIAISNIPGVTDVDVELSEDGIDYLSGNIYLAITETAELSSGDIEVTVVV